MHRHNLVKCHHKASSHGNRNLEQQFSSIQVLIFNSAYKIRLHAQSQAGKKYGMAPGEMLLSILNQNLFHTKFILICYGKCESLLPRRLTIRLQPSEQVV